MLNLQIQVFLTKDGTCTVKLARAKLNAMTMTSGKLRRGKITCGCRQNFPASNDCLRLPQVTNRSLPAPARNICEATFVRARAELFELRDVFFYPVPKKHGKSNQLLFLSRIINPSNLILCKKRSIIRRGFFNPLSNNTTLTKVLILA